MILTLISLAAGLAAFWLLRRLSGAGSFLPWIMLPVFLAAVLRHPLFLLLGDSAFSPSLPRLLIIILSWCSGLTWLLGGLTLGWRILSLFPLTQVLGSGRRFGRVIPGSLILLCAGLTAMAGLRGLADPVTVSLDLPLEAGPTFRRPLKVVQLTDLHLSSLTAGDWFDRLILQIRRENPDLILLTGDVADGTVAGRSLLADRLGELRASLGTVLIPGNHEYYADYDGWMAFYRKLGFRVLENSSVTFIHEGIPVEITGVTDEQALKDGRPGPELPQADCPGSRQVLGDDRRSAEAHGDQRNGAVRILLKHRPLDAEQYAGTCPGFDLILSGHTHGGMILPLFPLVAAMNSGFVRGLYRSGRTWIYVSDGTFLWNAFPFRMGTRNTVAVFTLGGDRDGGDLPGEPD